MQFQYNYQTNTLAYQENLETWHQIEEEQKFAGNFGSQGFQLKDGWITFSVYASKIRVFYKQGVLREDDNFWTPASIIYYRKDLPKQPEVSFAFAEADQVEKVGPTWVKKNRVLSETKGANHD